MFSLVDAGVETETVRDDVCSSSLIAVLVLLPRRLPALPLSRRAFNSSRSRRGPNALSNVLRASRRAARASRNLAVL